MQKGSKILVIGATGAMGTHVIQALLADENHDYAIRALTRYPRSYRAKRLRELSSRVEIAEGDSNDISTIKDALEGIKGVFCNTDYWSSGKDAEIRQGKSIVEACKWADIDHFIYSSLDNTKEISGGRIQVPFFDSKAEVENYIRSRKSAGDAWYSANTTVLVTAPYMENFQSYFLPKLINGEWVFKMPLEDKPWPMIALSDIGAFAAYIFANPDKTKGKTLKIGSTSLTMEEIVEQFKQATGQKARYEKISLADYRASQKPGIEELAAMFQFMQEYGLKRDYSGLKEILPGLMSFKEWLEKTGWTGEEREVQKDFIRI